MPLPISAPDLGGEHCSGTPADTGSWQMGVELVALPRTMEMQQKAAAWAGCGSFLCNKNQKVESIRANFPWPQEFCWALRSSPWSVTKAVKYSPEYSVNENENYEEKLVTVLKIEKRQNPV